MESFHEVMMEYKQQMQLGVIPRAYRGIMEYMLGLKAYLQAEYPTYNVSGNIYFGYMDMSYFSFFSYSLQQRKLKTGIVFIHESCQFEAWLFGVNKQVQKQYWQLIKDSGWNQYPLVATIRGEDAILKHVLTPNPDYDDMDAVTEQIEKGSVKFIQDVDEFMSGLQ
jgi:hypothetical protein